jgi:hypothetical protein
MLIANLTILLNVLALEKLKERVGLETSRKRKIGFNSSRARKGNGRNHSKE